MDDKLRRMVAGGVELRSGSPLVKKDDVFLIIQLAYIKTLHQI